MAEETEEIEFSPILIMEYLRQVTVARFLAADTLDMSVRFKLPKVYYEGITSYPLQALFINLEASYDEATEILTLKANERVLSQFRSQKSLMEIAGKYENQYKERYKKFVEVLD
jgi:hypothetical protein